MKKNVRVLFLFMCAGMFFLACACSSKNTAILSFVADNGQDYAPIRFRIGYEVALPQPTREDFVFDGWYVDVERQTPLDFAKLTDDTVVYAKWVPQRLSVSFFYFDGKKSTIEISYGETLDLPTDTYRPDHRFLGWYSDESFILPFDQDAPITSDIKLFGRWDAIVYHFVSIVDWDGTTLYEGVVEDGQTLRSNLVFVENLAEFDGFLVNGVKIESDSYEIFDHTIFTAAYNYTFSDANLFEFVNDSENYYIKSARPLEGEIFLPPTYKGKLISAIASAQSPQDGAFFGSEITEIYIPSSFKTVGSYAFYDCKNLETIYFPASLCSIGVEVFRNCSSLKAFLVHEDNAFFQSSGGALLGLQQNILFCYPYGNISSSYVMHESVELIAPYAFEGAVYLQSLDLSKSTKLREVGDFAFYRCTKLDSVELPDSVEIIGKSAFAECFSLLEASIGQASQLRQIGDSAFADCKLLESFYIPKNAVFLDGGREVDAVFGGAVKTFLRTNALTAINVSTQNSHYKSMDGVLYSKGLEILYFFPTAKKSLQIESATVRINDYAFYYSSGISWITLPDSIEEIGTHTFEYSKLVSITLPASLKSIGVAAFRECTQLTTLVFEPNSQLTFLGEFSFYGCSSLTNFVITAIVPPLGAGQTTNFFGGTIPLQIQVPPQSLEAYQQKWHQAAKNIVAIVY